MDFRKASQAHVVPHFTKGAAWNADDLIVMDHAEGCYVTDSEGKRYLDGLAGLFCTNLGHGRVILPPRRASRWSAWRSTRTGASRTSR